MTGEGAALDESLSREELLAMPVSAVIDGWKLGDGRMYLFVRVTDRLTQTVTVP